MSAITPETVRAGVGITVFGGAGGGANAGITIFGGAGGGAGRFSFGNGVGSVVVLKPLVAVAMPRRILLVLEI